MTQVGINAQLPGSVALVLFSSLFLKLVLVIANFH